ncbi:MAG: HupE/UreJ family protein [Gemmatimonadaceae bacterium]|nr:HupE/UreJ family protein [Gemmatimonadaceae bacterium]
MPRRIASSRPFLLASLLVSLLCGLLVGPAPAAAHEMPARVALRGYVAPSDGRVRVALRLPLAALRDLDFPLRPDGTLDLEAARPRIDEGLRTWVLPSLTLESNDEPLGPWQVGAWRVRAPGDRAFETWAGAQPPRDDAEGSPPLRWQEALLDVWLEVPGTVDLGALSLTPALAHLGVRTSTVLTLVLPDGVERTMRYVGNPGRMALDPSWFAAAGRFVREGLTHIWGGLDHLLFVLCLVLPVRGWRPLVTVVTAFTLAHSITLAAAALGFVPEAAWFPPLVELGIAVSILWMAIENVLLPPERLERRWPLAFAFGLVHGLGFAYALGDALQFAGRHLVTALAAFNVGVELGQLAVLAVAVPALAWLARQSIRDRALVLVGSLLIGHAAWHWMLDRTTTLGAYDLARPALDLAFWRTTLRVLFVLTLAATAAWGFAHLLRRFPAKATVGLLLVLALSAPLRDAVAQPSRTTQDGIYTTPQAQRGKDVFAGTCQSCHDVNAHAGPAFRTNWTGRTLDALFEFLKASMPKSDPGTLSDEEYVDVIAFLLKQNRMPAGLEPLVPDPAALARIRFDTTAPPAGRALPRRRR